MNCSQAALSMLMSVLVCSRASHCLLINLISVEHAENQAPQLHREGGGTSISGFLDYSRLEFLPAELVQVIKNQQL